MPFIPIISLPAAEIAAVVFTRDFKRNIDMDSIQMMLLGFPALLMVAKFAILAVAVALSVRGILHPYGRSAVAGEAMPAPVRPQTPASL